MVAALVIGEPYEIKERKPIAMSNSELKKYSGEYKLLHSDESSSISIRQIMVEDDRIYFGIGVTRRIEIFPESATLFFIPDVAGTIRFEFDDEENVIRFFQNRSDGSILVGEKTNE